MSGQSNDNWVRLHISGLPKDMSEGGLIKLVEEICKVRNVKVINPEVETKRFAYGFFNVPSVNVQKVVDRLDGFGLQDHILKVHYATPRDNDRRQPSSNEDRPRISSPGARPKQPQMNNNTIQQDVSGQRCDNWVRLHISGLPKEMSEGGLINLVGQVCKVRNVKVVNSADETKRCAFGFFNVSGNDVEKVVSRLDGYQLQDYVLIVHYARDRYTKQPSFIEDRQRRAKQPRMDNNTKRCPVTPRTLENRFGKTLPKPPTSQVNATHSHDSSVDEIKQSSLNMVPVSVTSDKHNARWQQGAEEKPRGGRSDILPSKGRGRVLESVKRGKQSEAVGKVNSKREWKEHARFQLEKEDSDDEESVMSYDEYVKRLIAYDEYVKSLNNSGTVALHNRKLQDKMQHSEKTDGRMQDKSQHKETSGFQNEKIQDKKQPGKGTDGRMQDKLQHKGTSGYQNEKIQDKMQQGKGTDGRMQDNYKGTNGLQNERMQDRMQQCKGTDGNELCQSMQSQDGQVDWNQHEPGQICDKVQQRRGQITHGRVQDTRAFPKREDEKDENSHGKIRGNVGIENKNAKEQQHGNVNSEENITTCRSNHEKTKDTPRDNIEYMSVLEECPDVEEQLQNPPRPFTEVAKSYPNPSPYMHPPLPPPILPPPMPAYGYWPYLHPPWNGYYGYYPQRPAEIWRPARQPYHHEYYPQVSPYIRNSDKKRPYGSTYRMCYPTVHSPSFPKPYLSHNEADGKELEAEIMHWLETGEITGGYDGIAPDADRVTAEHVTSPEDGVKTKRDGKPPNVDITSPKAGEIPDKCGVKPPHVDIAAPDIVKHESRDHEKAQETGTITPEIFEDANKAGIQAGVEQVDADEHVPDGVAVSELCRDLPVCIWNIPWHRWLFSSVTESKRILLIIVLLCAINLVS